MLIWRCLQFITVFGRFLWKFLRTNISLGQGITLHRFSLDRTHRLGRKRIPRPDTEVPKPRPIIAKFINYHDRDSVYKCKRKLKEPGLTIVENLTKRRVNLLNEVREAVGMKNTWTFDGRIHGMCKGKNIT